MTLRAGGNLLLATTTGLSAMPGNGLVYAKADGLYTRNIAGVEMRVDDKELDTGWIAPTLQNDWVAYGSGYGPPLYRKRRGIVYCKGLVKNGTPLLGTIFTLPVGFRPTHHLMFVTIVNQHLVNTASANGPSAHVHSAPSPQYGAANRMDVANTGSVNVGGGDGSNGYVSLDGIVFPAEA